MTITRVASALILKIGLTAALVLSASVPAAAQGILVIAHRGASGERPEHTLAAFERAIDQGADYIEPDVVVTSDNVLVVRHENELSGTTDVAAREEFAGRRRTKTIDGKQVSGWFAEDFTLAELQTLRAKERLAAIRPANARYDGLYPVPTFAEVIQLVRAKEAETGRRIGLYPEVKHATFLLAQGFDVVDLLVTALKEADLDDADDRVFVQSFEVGPLQRLDKMIAVPLVQLVSAGGGPADEPRMTYAEMTSPAGLASVARYADVLGADLAMLFRPDGAPTGLIGTAQDAGLKVHAWTLRKENAFLPPLLKKGDAATATGDVAGMVAILKSQNLDGVITDDPGLVFKALGR